MSREEQIKNMARAIHLNCHKGLTSTEAEMISKWCYQEIDKKASEVAEEIFAEIEDTLEEIKDDFRADGDLHHASAVRYSMIRIAELKKKYTESEDTE